MQPLKEEFPTSSLSARLFRALQNHRFALAAFLLPVVIRAIPEILVGQFQVGWDTIAFYVPNTLDSATGRLGWVQLLGIAPLMYTISVPIYLLTRVNPVWIFKIMGPLLYGAMMIALFRFLRTGLEWSAKMSLGAVIFASLYFVTLRISWDMYRTMLGLTFVILSLPLFQDWKTPRNRTLLGILTALSVASDQLTGVISLVLIGARILRAITNKRHNEMAGMMKIGLPGTILFSAIAYVSLIAQGNGLVQSQTPLPTLAGLGLNLGFLGFAYLFLSPLILLGIRKVPTIELKNWSIFCLVLVALALMPFFGPNVTSYRWTLLLDIPLCVYASAGLARLAMRTRPLVGWALSIQRQTLPIVSTLLMLSAALYIGLPAQQALIYYTAFPPLSPTSMIQDTVPASDMMNLRAMLNWVQQNALPGSVLIAHQAIYGWARAYLPQNQPIINYGYSFPSDGAKVALMSGYSSVLMIWWVNGSGWHGQPYVPQAFVPVSTEGDMAVYAYH